MATAVCETINSLETRTGGDDRVGRDRLGGLGRSALRQLEKGNKSSHKHAHAQAGPNVSPGHGEDKGDVGRGGMGLGRGRSKGRGRGRG
ncbi:hypothetical protein V866_002555 [Kwoniella sp. B9012]